MSDISEKKAISTLGELEIFIGSEYAVLISKTYDGYRSKGYSRFESARLTWKKIMEDFFEEEYENLKYEEEQEFNTIKKYFFELAYGMAGIDPKTKIAEQRYEKFRKSYKPYDALKKTYLSFTDMGFQYVLKGGSYLEKT